MSNWYGSHSFVGVLDHEFVTDGVDRNSNKRRLEWYWLHTRLR